MQRMTAVCPLYRNIRNAAFVINDLNRNLATAVFTAVQLHGTGPQS